jgi:hypothetical protein
MGYDICDMNVGMDYNDYKYTYISTILMPKPHRCLMMDHLYKNNLFDIGAISWREFDRNLDRSQIPEGMMDSEFQNYPWKYWKPHRIFLDQATDIPNHIMFDWIPNEYKHSFMAIIGESMVNHAFLSEKTVVPLMYNKPFLINGAKNNHSVLKRLGFELYDEIFDYSFDSEEEPEDRVQGIIENIIKLDEQLKTIGHKKIHDKIRDKLLFNKHRAHEICVDPNHFPSIINDFFTKPIMTSPKTLYQGPMPPWQRYGFFEFSRYFYDVYVRK